MNREDIQNDIRGALTFIANDLATRAKEKSSWSSKIPSAIKVGEIQQPNEGQFSISVIVDGSIAPMATAYEFGSGIHRDLFPSTYPIYPKNASALAFEWPGHDENYPRGGKFIGMAGSKFLFAYVDHPGVAARPYIQPSLVEQAREVFDRFAEMTIERQMSRQRDIIITVHL